MRYFGPLPNGPPIVFVYREHCTRVYFNTSYESRKWLREACYAAGGKFVESTETDWVWTNVS